MKNKGFTLIELLVVIVVIGILASIIMVSLSSAKTRAQDSLRKSDLRQVQTALNLYIDQQGALFPANAAVDQVTSTNANPAGSTNGRQSYLSLSTPLASYLPKFPNDPEYSATGSYQYRYLADYTKKKYELSSALKRCSSASCSDNSPRNTNDGGNDDNRFEIGTAISVLNTAD